MIKKILDVVLKKPLPSPSSQEKAFLYELQASFRDLPILETGDITQSKAAWLRNMNRLRELVLSEDPRKFLRWDVISGTMSVAHTRYILKELNYLKRRSDWKTRWRAAIKESSVGHPVPYLFYPTSSGTLIHHAYHVAQFEEKTGVKPHNIDCVLEFGGGYGSMCRLFFKLGFIGRYIILDLPSFSALQMYFLKTVGLPIRSVDTFKKSKTGVLCLSDIQQLRELLTDSIEVNNSMFIATWSISEVPINTRVSVLPLISGFRLFLIAYQDIFGEVNNVNFFNNWKVTT